MLKKVTLWACLLCASFCFATQTVKTKAGDTLQSLANDLGISYEVLRDANASLDGKVLAPGMDISVPDSITVKVGKYDTDWIIASRYRVTTSELKAKNPGIDFSDLQEGAELTVPIIIRARSGSPKLATAPVEAAKATTVAISNAPKKTVHVTGDSVRVRSLPSLDGRVMSTVDQGSTGLVISTKSGWYQLKFSSGLTGWVKGDFVAAGKAPDRPVVARATPRSSNGILPDVRNERSGSSEGSNSIVSTARTFIGVPYVYGGTSRGGIDCSGFVGAVYRRNGVDLPRTAAEQASCGRWVPRSELRPGDLLFFRTGRSSRISHVGIYIGDGQMIHASSGSGHVRTDSLSKAYYQRTFATARRIKNFRMDSSAYSRPRASGSVAVSTATIEDISPERETGNDSIGH